MRKLLARCLFQSFLTTSTDHKRDPQNQDQLVEYPRLSSSLMGSLAKGFLRKFCGKFAEIAKNTFTASGKGAEILRKFCGNFAESFLQ